MLRSFNSYQVTTAKPEKSAVGPWVVGFFVFVVAGSALFQIIRTATRGSYADAE
jgi:hypothetical protein